MQFSLGEFEPIADRVHVAVAEPASVNIGLVVGDTGALVIDTGSSPEQGRAIRAAAQAVAGDVPLSHVVVTHAHYDHFYGLAAFADLETIGHRGLAALLAAERPPAGELASFGMTDADVVAPRRTFGLATTIDLGGCHVELVHFGRGHTDHDVTVVVASRGVAFFGDLLETSAPPSAGPDAWPDQWPRTLDGTLGVLRRGFLVVPGHGPVTDREAAFMQRAELHWHQDKAVELYDAGAGPTGAWQPEGWPWPQEPTERFLTTALARLEASGRPRKRAKTLPLLTQPTTRP